MAPSPWPRRSLLCHGHCNRPISSASQNHGVPLYEVRLSLVREPVKGTTAAGRRREARARETRERIIQAGVRLFLERGYVATTVQAIADEAGVAAATVYQAFGTK